MGRQLVDYNSKQDSIVACTLPFLMKKSFPQQYLRPEREENFSEFCLKKEVDQITVVITFVTF